MSRSLSEREREKLTGETFWLISHIVVIVAFCQLSFTLVPPRATSYNKPDSI